MSSVLEALNLYPESRFWRVRGSPSVSNVAGGVATLIVIVLMSAFAVAQLVTVFNKTNMNVNSLSQSIQENSTVTAEATNSSSRPFMVAVEQQSNMFYYASS